VLGQSGAKNSQFFSQFLPRLLAGGAKLRFDHAKGFCEVKQKAVVIAVVTIKLLFYFLYADQTVWPNDRLRCWSNNGHEKCGVI